MNTAQQMEIARQRLIAMGPTQRARVAENAIATIDGLEDKKICGRTLTAKERSLAENAKIICRIISEINNAA